MSWLRKMRRIVWPLPDWARKFSLFASASSIQVSLSVEQALRSGSAQLSGLSASAGPDAQVLLAHILQVERAWLLAHPEEPLDEQQKAAWEEAVSKLEGGEALPYVLGEWEFFGLRFQLTPDVLIPRPETELLVERAIEWLATNPTRRRAIDVGTGSGCIAVTLAVKVANLNMIASDISAKALKVAVLNAAKHHVSQRVEIVQADLLNGQTGPFDLLCANLPYIPSERLSNLAVAKSEPRLALDGGAKGLNLIRPFLKQTASRLAPGGLLLAEIDDSQRESALELASTYFPLAERSVLEDLAGKPRLLRVAG